MRRSLFTLLDVLERFFQILDTPSGHTTLLVGLWLVVPFIWGAGVQTDTTRNELFGALLYALKGTAPQPPTRAGDNNSVQP